MSPGNSSDLETVIRDVGGAHAAAAVCEVTERAIYKWMARGRLPRTDYTGETTYAAKLAAASEGKHTAESILEAGRVA